MFWPKNIAKSNIKDLIPFSSSRSFMVSSLTLQSLIFVRGVKAGANFFLLHVNIQSSQFYLLKRLSCPYWVSLASLSNICGPYIYIYAWVYFWAVNAVSLVYMSVLCQYRTVLIITALSYDLRSGDVMHPALYQNCFSCLLSFVVPCKF